MLRLRSGNPPMHQIGTIQMQPRRRCPFEPWQHCLCVGSGAGETRATSPALQRRPHWKSRSIEATSPSAMAGTLERQALPSFAAQTGSHSGSLLAPRSVFPVQKHQRRKAPGLVVRAQAAPGTGFGAGGSGEAKRRNRDVSTSALSLIQPLLGIFGGAGKAEKREDLKQELLECIAPLQRGVTATEEDQEIVESLARQLETLNPTPSTVTSPLINGKWKLIYTTSGSIIGANRLPFLRPFGPIFQCIDNGSLQAQNIETWPFFGRIQATLTPVSKTRVNVRFDEFKIASLIPFKAPQREGAPQAFLDTTYLDEDIRISRGNLGNLFVLTMEDDSYRIEEP